jgi:polar amino acid transport system permease protein
MDFAERMARVLIYSTAFGQSLLYTVILSACTVVIGFVIALVVALMRLSKSKILRIIASVYVEFIRSTPMLVQLFISFYVLFAYVIDLPRFTMLGFIDGQRFIPGIVALSLNSGAYLSEILRSGIQSIDIGQTEAARSLGLTQGQNMRYIVLPQAIKNILPAIANEFVTIIKESSVCMVLGMQEIMFTTKLVQNALFQPVEPLIVATVMYFVLTFPTSKIIQHFERKMRRGDVR